MLSDPDNMRVNSSGNQLSMDRNVVGNDAPFYAAVNIHKSFSNAKDRLKVIKGLDFVIEKAAKVAIVGASGIGKSTLLHILGTLDRPDRGQLLFKGQNLFVSSDDELAGFRNRNVGFVFQFHHLLPEFSALENTLIPGLIEGMNRPDAERMAAEILIRVGLKDRLNFRVNRLSGGEQQRVALARALVLKPAILLADEPTGNLDKKNSEQVHQLLVELNQELGMALVVVTHNMELAKLMAHRVTIMDGKLAVTD